MNVKASWVKGYTADSSRDLGPPEADWKVRLQAAALFWVVTAALFTGGARVASGFILGSVDERIAAHTLATQRERSQLGADLYSKLADLDKRLAVIERNCAQFETWKRDVTEELQSLHNWRANCSSKQSELAEALRSSRADVSRMETRFESLQQSMDRRHP